MGGTIPGLSTAAYFSGSVCEGLSASSEVLESHCAAPDVASLWMLSAGLPALRAHSPQSLRAAVMSRLQLQTPATSDQSDPATRRVKIATRCFSPPQSGVLYWWSDVTGWGGKVFWVFSMSQVVSDELRWAGQQQGGERVGLFLFK